ncbi:methyl-accepting chemotaxis protein [Paenibacillus monticola]|uniref:Methyl-accepting transducer domain-containing protein n=1 Tax=Paenibacillus monticola TaxID=2666075 RepID=A0A7X2L526_9BACL|nr:hypothetical protein [Paenibacillus monticola]
MERSVNELSSSSSQIQKIVAAVQYIADQTKILSLNATLKVARQENMEEASLKWKRR